MEYSYLLNIVKKDIEDKNDNILKDADISAGLQQQVRVNLPDGLKLK